MKTTALSAQGPTVSAVGLGCMGMSEFYGPTDREQSLATLRGALDLGVTLFDTADGYGLGENERLLGSFVAGVDRDDVVVCTKFGPVREPGTGTLMGLRGDPEYVAQACDASLERLGLDHIDLYYLHVPDPKVPIAETVGAMAKLVAAGKVRHLGMSNLGADDLRAAQAVHPIAVVESEWSLLTREPEESLLPTCAELGIGFVPYSPLGRGLLTQRFPSVDEMAPDDVRRTVPRFVAENADHNRDVLGPVHEVARVHGATTAQVALAWLCRRGTDLGVPVVPIPGAKLPEQVRENSSIDLALTDEQMASLEPLAGRIAGSNRHPPAGHRTIKERSEL